MKNTYTYKGFIIDADKTNNNTTDAQATQAARMIRELIMPKTYICRMCGNFYVYDQCKLIVDGNDHAPTHCPYQTGKRASWKEVV